MSCRSERCCIVAVRADVVERKTAVDLVSASSGGPSVSSVFRGSQVGAMKMHLEIATAGPWHGTEVCWKRIY